MADDKQNEQPQDEPNENEETQEESTKEEEEVEEREIKIGLRRVAKGEISFDAFVDDSRTKLNEVRQEQDVIDSNTKTFLSTFNPLLDQLEAMRGTSLNTTLRQSFIQFWAYVRILKADIENESTRINNEQL